MKDFNKIYSESHKAVLAFILRKINDQVVAEELANDVFMKVYKHLDNYDSEKSALNTWIMNITSNVVIDYYRKRKMETISLDKPVEGEESTTYNRHLEGFCSSSSTPYELMKSNESVERIENTINDLPKKYALIAKLFFSDELSYEEIADRLAVPLGTVKGQISRARAILTSKLERV